MYACTETRLNNAKQWDIKVPLLLFYRECAVKFNDYFEFPREVDMSPYTAATLAKLEGKILKSHCHYITHWVLILPVYILCEFVCVCVCVLVCCVM